MQSRHGGKEGWFRGWGIEGEGGGGVIRSGIFPEQLKQLFLVIFRWEFNSLLNFISLITFLH